MTHDTFLDHIETRLEGASNPQHIEALHGVLDALESRATTGNNTASLGSMPQEGRIRGRRLSEVESQDIPWMWPGRIALGSIVIWYGSPGCGKSSAALEYIARVTQGWGNPDGSSNDYPGSVVMACFEDSLEYTVVDRLRRAGADLSKISDISLVEKADTERGGTITKRFSLDSDLAELAAEVRAMKASLVVLDPMLSMFGSISNFNNQKVGDCLDNLKRWAEEQGVAVLLVAHATKDGTTLAGGAQTERAARFIFHFARDKAHKNTVIVSNVKNNLAPAQGNMAFTKSADDTIEWVHGEEPGLQKKHDAQRYGALRTAMLAEMDAHPQTLFSVHSFMDIENYNFATCKTHLLNMRKDGVIQTPERGKYASLLYVTPNPPVVAPAEPIVPGLAHQANQPNPAPQAVPQQIENEKTTILNQPDLDLLVATRATRNTAMADMQTTALGLPNAVTERIV